MPLRIALATLNRNQWSETFIAAHIQRLERVVAVFTRGLPPRRLDGRHLLLPRSIPQRLFAQWEHRVLGLRTEEVLSRQTARALRLRGVQVMLAEYGHLAQSLVPACEAAGVPLVAHFHGKDAHAHALVKEYGNYALLFRHAAAIVVVSRAMEQRILELGAPKEKVHYNTYGVDLGLFTPGTPGLNPPRFIGVGRFVDKKAPQLTLMAFREAWRQRPEARLTLVGDGALRESVRQLVQVWGLGQAVELPGVLPPADVAARLRDARAFVQHSVLPTDGDSEGTPVAVLEAMASGLPVIATRHAGIMDVVAEHERGLLGDEYDVQAMAAHMVQLIDHPDQASAMGRAGRAYAEQHHRIEYSVARLQGILARAAGQASVRS